MKLEIIKHTLNFRFEAGTSRGVMTSKDAIFLKLYDPTNLELYGLGECSPLKGLSPEEEGNLTQALSDCVEKVARLSEIKLTDIDEMVDEGYPALRFALETAVIDRENGGHRILFNNDFSASRIGIPINGLVWMGDKKQMLSRLKNKIDEGFECIKIKIGAIDLDDELELIKLIRKKFSAQQITIRLDANGAFRNDQALEILNRFAKYDIHSIEQPIKAGNSEAMEKICRQSPIPVALDEELIGVFSYKEKAQLLMDIQPAYIILKPTLVGGFQKSKEWIQLAYEHTIGWWITSALESNVGLNAIAQFAAEFPITIPQGLGTGQLFHNNIPSPLTINDGLLSYENDSLWDYSLLE